MVEVVEISPGEPALLSYLAVQELYRVAEASKNGQATDYALTIISHYPIWTHESYDAEKLSQLKIYNDQGPWTSGLTDNGRDLSIAHAASSYLKNPSYFQQVNPDFAKYIEGIVAKSEIGIKPKPAFIVPGSKYKEAPLSDFIDGTKSTLALYISHLETGQPITLEVYVGKKAPVWQRAANKFFGKKS